MPTKDKQKPGAKKTSTAGKMAPEVFDTEAFLTTAGVGRTLSTYKARSFIFRQGVACDAVYYILEGNVDLSVVSKQGKERVVGQLGPHDFLGEGCLAGHPVYLASARPPLRRR